MKHVKNGIHIKTYSWVNNVITIRYLVFANKIQTANHVRKHAFTISHVLVLIVKIKRF